MGTLWEDLDSKYIQWECCLSGLFFPALSDGYDGDGADGDNDVGSDGMEKAITAWNSTPVQRQ